MQRREVIGGEGFFGTTKLLENVAAIEVRFRVWRTVPGGFFISGERIFVASELLQHRALVEQICTIGWPYRLNRRKAGEGFVKTSKSFKQGAAIRQRFAMGGAPTQCILIRNKCIGNASKAL